MPRRAVTLPCVRCGDPRGSIAGDRHQTPQRIDGRRFGYDGAICGGCWRLLDRRAKQNKTGKPRAWELAEAFLAFRDALDGDDPKEAARLLAEAVALSEMV